jgi:hypothetical protein
VLEVQDKWVQAPLRAHCLECFACSWPSMLLLWPSRFGPRRPAAGQASGRLLWALVPRMSLLYLHWRWSGSRY